MRRFLLALLLGCSGALASEQRPFPTLWVLSEVVPRDFKWSDLGLTGEGDFSLPLQQSWVKHLTEASLPQVGEVRSCLEDCRAFLANWEEKLPLETIGSLPPQFARGLLLKVSIGLQRGEDAMGQEFAWDGRVLLLGLEGKKVHSALDLGGERQRWFNLDQKTLNSALASRIYRSPLWAIKDSTAGLERAKTNHRAEQLVITGYRNLGDIQRLIQVLKARGSDLGIEVKLDSFQNGEARLLCLHSGEENSFKDLLSQVKELKSSQSYTLATEFTGSHYRIKLEAR